MWRIDQQGYLTAGDRCLAAIRAGATLEDEALMRSAPVLQTAIEAFLRGGDYRLLHDALEYSYSTEAVRENRMEINRSEGRFGVLANGERG